MAITRITSANIADGTITNADISASASIDASKLTGTGKVLNVAYLTDGTYQSTTAGGWFSVWSHSYTPVSNSSQIYLQYVLPLRGARQGGLDARIEFRLLADSVEQYKIDAYGNYDYGGSGSWWRVHVPVQYKISNTTGSAISLGVDLSIYSANNVEINGGGSKSILIITEVEN